MPHILTTHVGSLVRPAELIEFLLAEQNHKPYDKQQFEACLKRSVEHVIAQQVDAGIDIVTDGEFGKTISWSRYILERLSGFEERQDEIAGVGRAIAGKDRRDFSDFYDEYEGTQGFAGLGKQAARIGTWVITGPIRYSGQTSLQRDIDNLKSAAKKAGAASAFLPVVAPASVAPNRKDEFYNTEEEALFAIADALNEEYRAIVDAGLIVQVDDAYLASVYDLMVPPQSLDDYRKWAAVRVEAVNRALKGIPQDRSRYSLEMANPRHEHEWRVWEHVKLPTGKVLLPGLVSHSTNVVEHPELVAERIVRLAKLIGADRVIASTDCGFAQGPFARRVHPSIMWAKLRSLSEGARLAEQQL
jgi:5-methyltetrahydropteroyltriglutamate--homocysteine methyltransferase